MKAQTSIEIKHGHALSSHEIEYLSSVKTKEWNTPPIDEEQKNELFVLVRQSDDTILAQGQIFQIENVRFNNMAYTIMGIGGIISSVRGKGYGRQLLRAITEYLTEKNLAGIGFTGIPSFYEKSGFTSSKDLLSQFVYQKEGKKHINTTDEYLVYFDPTGALMENVKTKPSEDVVLPRFPDW